MRKGSNPLSVETDILDEERQERVVRGVRGPGHDEQGLSKVSVLNPLINGEVVGSSSELE